MSVQLLHHACVGAGRIKRREKSNRIFGSTKRCSKKCTIRFSTTNQLFNTRDIDYTYRSNNIFSFISNMDRNNPFKKTKKIGVGILFIIYMEVLLQTAFFSREAGSRKGIDLTILSTWGKTAQEHAYFIENIMMFVPLGILLPMLFKKIRKLQYCVLTGFLCSCTIEVSQLITQRGFCQLDDVITNTVGAVVGWMIWQCVWKCLHNSR